MSVIAPPIPMPILIFPTDAALGQVIRFAQSAAMALAQYLTPTKKTMAMSYSLRIAGPDLLRMRSRKTYLSLSAAAPPFSILKARKRPHKWHAMHLSLATFEK